MICLTTCCANHRYSTKVLSVGSPHNVSMGPNQFTDVTWLSPIAFESSLTRGNLQSSGTKYFHFIPLGILLFNILLWTHLSAPPGLLCPSAQAQHVNSLPAREGGCKPATLKTSSRNTRDRAACWAVERNGGQAKTSYPTAMIELEQHLFDQPLKPQQQILRLLMAPLGHLYIHVRRCSTTCELHRQ